MSEPIEDGCYWATNIYENYETIIRVKDGNVNSVLDTTDSGFSDMKIENWRILAPVILSVKL